MSPDHSHSPGGSTPGAACMTRREWMRRAGLAAGGAVILETGAGLLCGAALAEEAAPDTGSGDGRRAASPDEGAPERVPPREASWYEKLPRGAVRCHLCPNFCEVEDGDRGDCGVRENRGGVYHTLVWGNACALNDDAVEKKPLFHYRPGTRTLSLATAGCNMQCRFCQNWNISQAAPEDVRVRPLPPRRLARLAKLSRFPSIAFTYTEPVVFAEYVRDTAAAAREIGVETVMISNGYIDTAPMKELCKVLAAVKVDLKGFTDRFYRELCGVREGGEGGLAPVLRTLETVKKSGTWLEIVNLVIPTWNDSDKEARKMAAWIVKNLGKDVPLHFTQFHPTYKLRNLPRTPVATLVRMRKIALAEGVRYVYVGNVPGHEGEHTKCPGCGTYVIARVGYSIVEKKLKVKDGRAACAGCGTPIAGRF